MALQIALKALNDLIKPNKLVLTFLVFKAYFRIIETNAPLLTVI